ncbi:MAG: UvrD-helicase domain-containing protein, partial [Clostridia bacterium]|nr:UvrD-helicase domain-containing protein [Clostridia bacterium]
MKRNWTAAQQSAINERKKTLLVSAAAGSGKTAVLTERIITSLIDKEAPADISRILVVTFTRAAASELRTRISAALSEALSADPENERLARQLVLLGSASISTIDSFYLNIVREHFAEAGFPPAFRPADENELLPLRRELMNDTVDRMYKQEEHFYMVDNIFADIRRENVLCEALLEVRDSLMRYPEGIDILLRSATELENGVDTPLSTPWGKVWCDEVRRLAETGRALVGEALSLIEAEPHAPLLLQKYGAAYNELLQRCREITERLERADYSGVCEALLAPFVCAFTSKKLPECGDIIPMLAGAFKQFKTDWPKRAKTIAVFSAKEIAETATESAQAMRVLHKTLSTFESEYFAAKMQREIAEFSDVSRAAYHLLVNADGTPTALAREIAASFDSIYIDEYQDVDGMQDATFRAISTPTNRFMVGDIKQSIYRFRGAQPAVFAGYRRSFPTLSEASESNEATIFMSDCFRCDEPIIKFSNTVSGYLFSRCADSIGYTSEDDLHFAKGSENKVKCRVVLVDKDKDSTAETSPEVRWIAAEINRLINWQESPTKRCYRPEEIAVLLRSSGMMQALEKELSALGIPVKDTSAKSFFENADVLCVYSLLAALDNPLRDVYMAAALRSPFFGFSLDELVRIRACEDGSLSLYEAAVQAVEKERFEGELGARLQSFYTRFSLWREKAKNLPVDRLLRYLYRESAILSFAGREGEDTSAPLTRRDNLRRLYEYARSFESGAFKGLFQFIRYVDGIMENGGTVKTPEAAGNAVSLITIHHSKGLEFPVCFIAGGCYRFTGKESQDTLVSDEFLGCGIKLCNAGPFSRTNTFFRDAILRDSERQAIEEEMRVLYVAMTRARERLYVTANPASLRTSADKIIQSCELAACSKNTGFLTANGPDYIHWVLTALYRTNYEDFASIEVVDELQLAGSTFSLFPFSKYDKLLAGEEDDACEEEYNEPTNEEICDELRRRFAWKYPFEHLTRLPAKLSVSRLSPGVLDVYDSDSATPDAIREADAEQLLHGFERAPLFGAKSMENEAAQKGTATHEFLQFCDFERCTSVGVREELARLVEQRYLPPETAELVR